MIFGLGVVVAYNFNVYDIVNALTIIYQELNDNFYNFYQNSIKTIINQLIKLITNSNGNVDLPTPEVETVVEETESILRRKDYIFDFDDNIKPSDGNNSYFFFKPLFYVPFITLTVMGLTYYFYSNIVRLLTSSGLTKPTLPNINTNVPNVPEDLLLKTSTPLPHPSDEFSSYFRAEGSTTSAWENDITPPLSPSVSDGSASSSGSSTATIGKGKGRAF